MAEKYWFGGANNHKGEWDYDGITPFTIDAGDLINVGGLCGIGAVGHGLMAGDEIAIAGTSTIDGTYSVHSSMTADIIVIDLPYFLLSGTNSIVAGTQWTAAGINLYTSGVEAGMRIKLWNGNTLLGAKYSGSNGIVSGTTFTASGLDFYAMGVEVGMTIKLTSGATGLLGEFAITSITDATHLEIADTGTSESGLIWEIEVRDAATWGGFEIISVLDAGHLQLESTGLSQSGVTYEIVRGETFDGTEIVTPNVDSNWKLVADGSNTDKPTDGDVLHFNDRAYYDITAQRYQGCTINVDSDGTGTPNLDGVFVSAGFNGSIGSEGQPLEINCDSEDIVVDGECTIHLKLSAGAGADAGCGRLVVNNEKANVYVSSLLNDASNVCLYDLLICLKGYLWIQDNCAVGEVVSANYSSFIDAGVGIENIKGGNLCSITAVKGEIVWRSKIDQVKLFDAEFAWGDEDMTEVVNYACNLLTIYSKSGEFQWQMADTGESLIKQFVLYAGNLIASQSVNSGYKKKIGTGTEISELWPDATANLNSSSNNVLIEAGSKLESHGGTLIASSGSLLGW
ncbi:MAG: hypothetical protein OEV87_01240 [Phycisphaerae bacterium]|nr:hypothetical protein [Phycisphaerae bacterium]